MRNPHHNDQRTPGGWAGEGRRQNGVMADIQFEYDHWYADDLPGDPDDRVVSRQVPGAAWSPVDPTATGDPRLVAHSPESGRAARHRPADQVTSEQFARVFSGNEVLDGMRPHRDELRRPPVRQLGRPARRRSRDQHSARSADAGRRSHQVLQLKGAGPTPYSRSADGRAVLRSSMREFLCSEAMHHLGVPTTRALSLTLTGDQVVRDMFYDGNPPPEPGAVVCRVAPTFVRFGHFELPASPWRQSTLLRATRRPHDPPPLRPPRARRRRRTDRRRTRTRDDDVDRRLVRARSRSAPPT